MPPSLYVVKELDNKHDYISAFLDSDMIALISTVQISWIEKRDGDYYLFRQITEKQIERLKLTEYKALVLFVHIAEDLKKKNVPYSVIEAVPIPNKHFRNERERITSYFEFLSDYSINP